MEKTRKRIFMIGIIATAVLLLSAGISLVTRASAAREYMYSDFPRPGNGNA